MDYLARLTHNGEADHDDGACPSGPLFHENLRRQRATVWSAIATMERLQVASERNDGEWTDAQARAYRAARHTASGCGALGCALGYRHNECPVTK